MQLCESTISRSIFLKIRKTTVFSVASLIMQYRSDSFGRMPSLQGYRDHCHLFFYLFVVDQVQYRLACCKGNRSGILGDRSDRRIAEFCEGNIVKAAPAPTGKKR